MGARFSKLKERLKLVLRPGAELRMQVYRMKSQYGGTNLPVFTLLEDKKELWRYPNENSIRETQTFKYESKGKEREYTSTYQYPYLYGYHEATGGMTVCDLIRKYIDTPREELKKITDPFGLFEALRKVDKRISRKQHASVV